MGLVGLVLFACLIFSVGAATAGGPEVGRKAHRVVMHLSKNLYEAMGAERLNVELVVHGAGLSLFIKQDTKLAEELERLKAYVKRNA